MTDNDTYRNQQKAHGFEGHYAGGQQHSGADYFAWARTPGFNPMKAVAVVAGFAVFPPLGVAALLYFVWKSRRSAYGPWRGHPAYAMAGGHGCGGRHRGFRRGFTGNRAFDEYQEAVMSDLAAEREAFHAYREEERRKRDQDAFNTFRTSRPAKDAGAAQDGSKYAE